MHSNTCKRPVGKVTLLVKHSGQTGHNHQLCFYLYHAFTSKADFGKGCLQRNATNKLLDCDTIHTVTKTATSEVPIEAKEALNDYVPKYYSDVFDGLGQIPGDYEI